VKAGKGGMMIDPFSCQQVQALVDEVGKNGVKVDGNKWCNKQ
jgi:hypothetical protein